MSRLLVALLLACGCSGSEPAAETPLASTVVIVSVVAPQPVLEGSSLRVATRGLTVGAVPRLQLGTAAEPLIALLSGLVDPNDGTRFAFIMSRAAIDALGEGEHNLRLVLTHDVSRSAAVPLSATLATRLDVGLDEVPQGAVYRESHLTLRARGLLGATEGTVEAMLHGNYTPAIGEPLAVTARLPVARTQADDRTRGTMRLTTDLGGVGAGRFEGTVQLISMLTNGTQSTSAALSVALDIAPPVLFVGPELLYLGQAGSFRGAGLLGAADRTGEATLLRFEGVMTGVDGSATDINTEIIAPFVSSEEVQLPLEVAVDGNALVSTLFGAARGVFTGDVTPTVLAADELYSGAPLPLTLTVGGPRQVAVVRFLPGFSASLNAFGLGLAGEVIMARVIEGLSTIYADYNVVFTLESPPADVLPQAVATIEIGGTDPNGLGVFGYDNTPGKDVGNLRLNDQIGGKNAVTREDGSAGYGGIFIESFLWWSSHPERPGARPANAPGADPLFDAVFDPVRNQSATLAEATGQGGNARAESVARAVGGLSHLIAETAAHEFGHSLGLADPYGSKTTFHNPEPGEGCLMDSGIDRPLGERLGEDGFATTHFCGDAPAYLQSILPR